MLVDGGYSLWVIVDILVKKNGTDSILWWNVEDLSIIRGLKSLGRCK